MAIDEGDLLRVLRNGVFRDALNGLPIPPGLFARLDLGIIVWGRNEHSVYSVVDDPSAFRGGATKGGLVKFSGNVLVEVTDPRDASITWRHSDASGHEDGPTRYFREEEVVLLQFKQDERFSSLDPKVDRRALTGVVTLHLRDGSQAGDGMVKVLELAHDYGWTPWGCLGDTAAAQAANAQEVPSPSLHGVPTPPTSLPGDAFAQEVRTIYRDILKRPNFPYATDPEVDQHRGNPGGIDAVRALCVSLGPGH